MCFFQAVSVVLLLEEEKIITVVLHGLKPLREQPYVIRIQK